MLIIARLAILVLMFRIPVLRRQMFLYVLLEKERREFEAWGPYYGVRERREKE